MPLTKRINKNQLRKVLVDFRQKKKISLSKDAIALILSGGGARGAYQVGVWKAMHKAELFGRVKSVYGTSVGAINAASMAQGDFENAHDLWNDLNYSQIFADFEAVAESANYNPKAIYAVAKRLFRQRCLDVGPLKELLYHHLDEQAIRDSSIEFGLVTFDLTTRRRQYLSKADIPEGELIDYVIASASLYPIFPAHEIRGHRFIDGGIADNRPVNFLRTDPSIRQAMCIDLTSARHFWLKKDIREDLAVDYIIPSKLLGSPLLFDHERIERNLLLGYHDFFNQVNL